MRILPILALLALVAALLWLPFTDTIHAQSPAEQIVPSDWALIPDGIEPGDSFRLLFITSATTEASSTDIADYNAHAQTAAGGNDNIKPFKDGFRALVSTASVDARDNTGTTGAGVPVHWLGGDKVADDYADLYDGSWDSVSGKSEAGGSYTGLVWTGGNKAGQKSGQRHAGAAEVRVGDLGDVTLALSSPAAKAATEQYPLYALSPVITVAQPATESKPTSTPQPADDKNKDDGEGGDSTDEPGAIRFLSNEPDAGVLLVAQLFDPDGIVDGSVTWQWQRSVEGPVIDDVDNLTWVDITGATVISYKSTPGQAIQLTRKETDRWIRVTATYSDSLGAGKSASGQTRRSVKPSAPFEVTFTIPENHAVGSLVGTPVAITGYGKDRFRYAVSTWNAKPHPFSVDQRTGQLSLSNTIDYELRTTYDLRVWVYDTLRGEAFTREAHIDTSGVIVNITDVDEGDPTKFPQRSYSLTIPENRSWPSIVSPAPITVNGHAAGRFRYGLGGADAAGFWLRRNVDFPSGLSAPDQLMLWSDVDYESKATYALTLSAYDLSLGAAFTAASLVDTVDVTVSVADVDEAGSVSLDVFKPYYDEWKRPFRDVIQIWTATPVTATLSDPDSVVGEVSWQWYSADSGWRQDRDLELGPSVSQAGPWTALSGNGADTNVYTPQHADSNKWLRATATYTDVHGAKVVHGHPGAPVNPDKLRPEVWLTYEKANVNAPFDITINWMEEVIGFDQSDVDLTNATLSNWARSGLNYTATITPTVEGGVYIGIDENAATDMFNNTSTALYPVAGFNYDITPPTIRFDDSPGPFTRAETFYLTIDPSEDLNDHEVPFTADDLVVVNGTAGDFGKARFRARSYEVLITPKEGITHGEKVTVTVPAGVWSDWAGNATAHDAVFTTEIDLLPPTATITVRSLDQVDSHGYFTIDIEFSEPVKKPETGDVWQEVYGRLSVRDLKVRNGRVSSMERQFPVVRQTRYTTTWLSTSSGELFESLTSYPVSWGAIYIATVVPDKGFPKVGQPIEIWFPRGTVEDQAGNVNTAPIGRTQVERTGGPTVTVDGAPLGERRSQPDEPFNVTVTFSEEMVGFKPLSEMEVTGGAVTASAKTSEPGQPSVYSVTIDPDGPGRVSVKVPAEVARSKATRRLNAESNTLRYNVTVVPPGPTVALLASDAEDPDEVAERVNHPFYIKVTFSEEMVGFKALSEMEVTGGTITGAVPISEKGEPTELLVEITPDGPGTVTVKVPADVARSKETRDFNEESNTLTFNIVPVGS